MKYGLEKYKLLILLVLADLVFVCLHVLYVNTDLLPTNLYSLSRDRGYAEFLQYTQESWLAALFLLLGFKQRQGLYFVFSFLFFYFLVDDSSEFHERFGEYLADFFAFQPALGLRAVDWGELLVSAMFGLLFLISIALLYIISDLSMRKISLYMIGMIFVMAVFGVLLDMVEILVTHPGVGRLLVTIEEGGEMLVLSIITWFVFSIPSEPGKHPLDWLHSQKPAGST